MYAPGAYIVHRGDRSQHLYVVLQGTVTIENKEGEAGKKAGVGTVAGDIGALTEEARHASVYAQDNVLALEVDTSKMRHSFGAHPDFFMALVQSLAKFSNSTDDVIALTVQAAIEQQEVEQEEERERHEGLDPDKAMEIAARWRKLKEEERAAADRAREAAQKAIEGQTRRGH
jgi:CRP-like cAMP-binding protein